METRIHTADNLYTYITNVQQVRNLSRQIKQKEETLSHMATLENIYKDIGLVQKLDDDLVGRYTELMEEILVLKIKLNEAEHWALEFQLAALRED
jgi:hypothetical protein